MYIRGGINALKSKKNTVIKIGDFSPVFGRFSAHKNFKTLKTLILTYEGVLAILMGLVLWLWSTILVPRALFVYTNVEHLKNTAKS